MKLVNSSVNILDFKSSSIKEVFNNIEFAGRTCYKSVGTRYFRVPKCEFSGLNIECKEGVLVKFGPSFDNGVYISIADKLFSTNSELYSKLLIFPEEKLEDSSYYENQTALDFVDMLIKNKHYAMLEHGTIYLKVPTKINSDEWWLFELANNEYTKTIWQDNFNYITTNFRVIVENNWIEALKYICEPEGLHEKRVSVRFICDRGIMAELTRHRVFSFAVESTRYCNYSKDKFGNELTFIAPSGVERYTPFNEHGEIKNYLRLCEDLYLGLLNQGWKPQDARCVLPTCLKTEVVMTGFISDWQHFFVLRCDSHAHPDMQVLAKELKNKFSVLENEI